MKNTPYKRLKIIALLILFGGVVFFSYHVIKNKHTSRFNNQKPPTVSPPRLKGGEIPPGKNWTLQKEKVQKKNPPALQKPRNHPSGSFHESHPDHNQLPDHDYPALEINLADSAYYDPLRNAYVLKKSELFTTTELL